MMTDGFCHKHCQAITGAKSDGWKLRKVVSGVSGETKEGLHENRTGRQLDFLSEYYQL